MDPETYDIERKKWDALAKKALPGIRASTTDEDFQAHARRTATMVGMAEFLGDLHGKRVLEAGCGLGRLSVRLARSGAIVTAFDLSAMSVEATRKRAAQNDLSDRIKPVVASGEHLPFAEESFDVVVGKAVLHHLHADLAAPHLFRVLKQNGRAAFAEPLGMNPLLRFGRDHLPYAHKKPRGADEPLDYETIERWGASFREFSYREVQLLSMLERGFGFNRRFGLLRRIDDVLLQILPFLRRYCRYVVLTMVK